MSDEETVVEGAEAVEGQSVADSGAANLGDVSAADPVKQESAPELVPEWVPEKFVKDGEVNYEALAKSYTHLESKLGQKTEAPEAYELNLPEDYSVPEDDVLYSAFSETARSLGLTQEQHDAILNMFVEKSPEVEKANMEAWNNHLQEQFKMLGPDGNKRLKAIEGWVRNTMPQGIEQRVQTWLTSAEDVKALEYIMAQTRDLRLPRQVDSLAKTVDAAQLREMRYAKDDQGRLKTQVDPEYRKMVDRAYQDFYGNDPVEQIVTAVR